MRNVEAGVRGKKGTVVGQDTTVNMDDVGMRRKAQCDKRPRSSMPFCLCLTRSASHPRLPPLHPRSLGMPLSCPLCPHSPRLPFPGSLSLHATLRRRSPHLFSINMSPILFPGTPNYPSILTSLSTSPTCAASLPNLLLPYTFPILQFRPYCRSLRFDYCFFSLGRGYGPDRFGIRS